jgi:hypothetical protein
MSIGVLLLIGLLNELDYTQDVKNLMIFVTGKQPSNFRKNKIITRLLYYIITRLHTRCEKLESDDLGDSYQ